MSEAARKILCWGDVGLDRYLDEDRDRAGGCALNVARSLVLAEATRVPVVGCAGTVGEDGRWLRELLGSWGVDVQLLEVAQGPSPRQRIRLEGAERELCGHDAGVMLAHDPSTVLDELTDEGLYIPCFDATLAWAELAWREGFTPLALDLMDLSDVDNAWMEQAVFGSEVVFAGLQQGHSAIDRLAELARSPGAAMVVVTLGARGAVAFRGNETVRMQAQRVYGLVDTTGCGDAYAGTFLAHWTAGELDLAECMWVASLRAAQVATHRGAVNVPPVS